MERADSKLAKEDYEDCKGYINDVCALFVCVFLEFLCRSLSADRILALSGANGGGNWSKRRLGQEKDVSEIPHQP
jgi:hypothetical protein